MKQGKVWLVGAGPGDIGLFTLKGMEILSQADVVVYDSLVGQGVLAKVPSSARLINVGKRADRHTMKQEQINQVLLEEAQKGYRVVRLKGGDPFLFGRGGEELELLTANGGLGADGYPYFLLRYGLTAAQPGCAPEKAGSAHDGAAQKAAGMVYLGCKRRGSGTDAGAE